MSGGAMHSFDYSKRVRVRIGAQTLKLLCEIHELSGKLRCIGNRQTGCADRLTDVAKKGKYSISVRCRDMKQQWPDLRVMGTSNRDAGS
jgi:hypothetical protein